MTIKEKSIRGVGWSAVQNWGNQVILLAVFAVLARLLDPEDFGLVALANVFVAFFRVIAQQGLSMAIVQRRDLEEAHINAAFVANMAISVVIAAAVIAAADVLAALLDMPALAPIIRWLSVIFVMSGLSSVQQALLQRALDFKSLAARQLIAGVAGGAVGVLMALNGYGLWSLVGQQVTTSVVQVVVLWHLSPWRPALSFSTRHFREIFSFGANVMGIGLLESVNRNADNFLIGYFLGPVALGYYSIAYKLLMTLTRLFNGVLNKVAFSSFSALQADTAQLRHAFYSATRLTSLVTFPAYIGVSTLSPELVTTLFGEQWTLSIGVIQVLALVGIVESVYFFNANVMLAKGKASWRLILNLLSAAVNLIGFLIAVRWGIVAVAAAYVLRAYLLSPLPLMLVNRLIGLDYRRYFANLAAPLAAALVMSGVLIAARGWLAPLVGGLQLTVALIAIGVAVYALSISLLAPELLRQASRVTRMLAPGRKAPKT
ncbi:MAG: lipopolysaccharide biosynthesis protein [Pseudomonadota bacterium]